MFLSTFIFVCLFLFHVYFSMSTTLPVSVSTYRFVYLSVDIIICFFWFVYLHLCLLQGTFLLFCSLSFQGPRPPGYQGLLHCSWTVWHPSPGLSSGEGGHLVPPASSLTPALPPKLHPLLLLLIPLLLLLYFCQVRALLAKTVPNPSRLGDPDEYAHLVQAIVLNRFGW